jgi:hypothetical protein
MEIAFSISSTENKLVRGLNLAALFMSVFPGVQKKSRSKCVRAFPFRGYIVRFFHREFNTMYFAFKGINEELEKRIENITPLQAQTVLERHRKVKLSLIYIRSQLEKVNFIDDAELEKINRLCLDLCYDIEYIVRKRANLNKEKKQSELSKLVAGKSKDAIVASL